MSDLQLERAVGGKKASWQGGLQWAALEKKVAGQAQCWLEELVG